MSGRDSADGSPANLTFSGLFGLPPSMYNLGGHSGSKGSSRSSNSPAQSLPSSSAPGGSWWGMSGLAGLSGIASQLASQELTGGSGGQLAAQDIASQLAVQEYLARLQGARSLSPGGEASDVARSPEVGRQADAKAGSRSNSFLDSIRLPADTEIVRKSKDSDSSIRNSLPFLPAGLTIEKKHPGSRSSNHGSPSYSTSTSADTVEITKIPSGNGAVDMTSQGRKRPRDHEDEDGPLNLSVKTERPSRPLEGESSGASNPLDLFTSYALSGALLAEQIRQQQLASQLQDYLKVPGDLTAMHALLSLSKLQNHQSTQDKKKQADKSKNLGRGHPTVKPKKNTVASLLAQSRGGQDGDVDDRSNLSSWLPGYEDPERISRKRSSEDVGLSENEDTADHVGRQRSRQVVTDTNDLRIPLMNGWKRETIIREFSKSGIRGEVVYVAPCGKRFKQYPDIIRYLEKRGITEVNRNNFSFSTKILVGDFLRPTGSIGPNGEERYDRFSENEMNGEIEKIRRENGWKPRKRGKHSDSHDSRRDSAAAEEEAKRRKMVEAMKQEQKRRLEEELLLKKIQELERAKQEKEAIRKMKEAEKKERLEQLKREKEKQLEDRKRKQEELMRQRQEERARKLQEIEMKRQQAALLKEQERERKKQHSILKQIMDNKKRNDERRKKLEELRVEKEKERERRAEMKRLDMEIVYEMKKTVEDMALPHPSHLPEFPRVEGLQLSGECFANVLMVFEFIHNFGEILGFDVESLPSLGTLQSALLNQCTDAEDELLSVLTQLTACAVEDPGIISPQRNLTVLGQTLKAADITNTNISEILRVYLQARAQSELKLLQGLSLPEPKDRKEALQGGPFHQASEAYMQALQENKTYQMSRWLDRKPFLCLNPTEKVEILASITNDLLSNKMVVNQIESTMENVHVIKRKRLTLDNKTKKLRILYNRKFRQKLDSVKMEDCGSNPSITTIDLDINTDCHDEKDDTMSVMSDSTRQSDTTNDFPQTGSAAKKKGGKKAAANKKKAAAAPSADESRAEEDSEADNSDVGMSDDEGKEDEEDEKLSAEDLQKKIDRLMKSAKRKAEEFTFVSNTLRANDLGQDRFRRRYWHLAYAGGIYLEGVESTEPWKLGTADCSTQQSENVDVDPKSEIKSEEDLKAEVKNLNAEASSLSNQAAPPNPTGNPLTDTQSATKTEPTRRQLEQRAKRAQLKITLNAERLNLANHAAVLSMTLASGSAANGDQLNSSLSGAPLPELLRMEAGRQHYENTWFNLVATGDSSDEDFDPGRVKVTPESVTALINLEEQLVAAKKMNNEADRKSIPRDKCFGWWKLSSEAELCDVEASILHKGIREQNLMLNLRRGFDGVQECIKRVDPNLIDLTSGTAAEDNPGSPAVDVDARLQPIKPDQPGSWNRDVALRVEKYILEQIEALEDKVASASMQVPGWKVPDRALVDTLHFRPSCDEPSEEKGIVGNEDGLNTVEVAKQRLLELEAAIERRYLKAPLGVSKFTTLQNISMNASKQDESMDLDNESGLESQQDDDTATKESDEHESSVDKDGADEPEPEVNGDGSDKKQQQAQSACDGVTRGLQNWRLAVKNAVNAAQLAMAFYMLETSVAWDKSIMKAYCQFCDGGENENELLLCDGCDRGYHTYCFNPPITAIPEGDWYCYECINKATGSKRCMVCGEEDGEDNLGCINCPRAYHAKCLQITPTKAQKTKWQCPSCSGKPPKKNYKKNKPPKTPQPEPEPSSNKKVEPEPSQNGTEESAQQNTKETPKTSKKKKATKQQQQQSNDKELSICHTLLSELGGHDEAWPFLNPVNTKQFPTYKRVVKTPMDISTVKKKLNDGSYKTREEFRQDVHLIFQNCQVFNEDGSPVGKAGRKMKSFFESRWNDLSK